MVKNDTHSGTYAALAPDVVGLADPQLTDLPQKRYTPASALLDGRWVPAAGEAAGLTNSVRLH